MLRNRLVCGFNGDDTAIPFRFFGDAFCTTLAISDLFFGGGARPFALANLPTPPSSLACRRYRRL